MKHLLLMMLVTAHTTYAAFDIQKAINTAAPGETVVIPGGVYTSPIILTKKITLTGPGAILKIEASQPAVLVETSQAVTLEHLEIQWKSTLKKGKTPFAVYTAAGNLTLKHCIFKALGTPDESPSAAVAVGRSTLRIKNCSFDGFQFPIQFGSGAKGSVDNCLIINPGYCGIMIGENGQVSLEKNIVTGSGSHGILCTGGKITAESNLIISNRVCGFYIGEKSATGKLANNLIVNNGTGIRIYGQSTPEIENNVIYGSTQTGLSVIEFSLPSFSGNIIAGNKTGAFGFTDITNRIPLVKLNGKNLVYGNPVEAKQAQWPEETLRLDPQFTDSAAGLFKPQAADIKRIGLRKPEELHDLWKIWLESAAN